MMWPKRPGREQGRVYQVQTVSGSKDTTHLKVLYCVHLVSIWFTTLFPRSWC